MAAYTFLAVKRKNREDHMALSLMLLADCGDPKAIKKQLEMWEKDT
jgi:hypothetical protein